MEEANLFNVNVHNSSDQQNTMNQLPVIKYEYASFLRRLSAYIFDTIIFRLFLFFLMLNIEILLSFLKLSIGTIGVLFNFLLSYGLLVLYNAFFISIFSSTPGKNLLNLVVLTEDNKKLNFFSSLIRSLFQPFSIVLLGQGYVGMLKDPKKQAWHDKVAKTVVILLPKPKNIFLTISKYLFSFIILLSLSIVLILIKFNYFK
jgi:uncharacterized RDD family membrane protein YckC